MTCPFEPQQLKMSSSTLSVRRIPHSFHKSILCVDSPEQRGSHVELLRYTNLYVCWLNVSPSCQTSCRQTRCVCDGSVLARCDDDLVLASVGTLVVFIIPLCVSCARTPTAYTSAHRRVLLLPPIVSREQSFCLFLQVIFRVVVCFSVLFLAVIPRPSLLYLTLWPYHV